jgi:hypothetical protein
MDFEWTRTVGADEYMLEVFPSSDPNGLGQPILRKDGVRPLGTGNVTVSVQFASGDLAPSSTFFWRAGARASLEADEQSGQGIPRVGFGSQELSGWVLSTMRSFQTTAEPPPTPAKVAKRKGGALERLGTPTARQQSARSRSRRERVTPVGRGVQEPVGGGRSGRQ